MINLNLKIIFGQLLFYDSFLTFFLKYCRNNLGEYSYEKVEIINLTFTRFFLRLKVNFINLSKEIEDILNVINLFLVLGVLYQYFKDFVIFRFFF